MKAMLLLDPDRRDDQLAVIAERAQVLLESGDRLWVEMNEALADRFADAGIQVQPQEGMDRIELPALVFDPAEGEPAVPPALAAPVPAGDAAGYHLLQFVVPPEPEWLQALEDGGGVFLGLVPSHAAVFAFSAAQAEAARAHPSVTWVGRYHPAYALSHELAGSEEPLAPAALATAQVDPEMLAPTPGGALRVQFFADVDLAAAAAAVAAAGAEVAAHAGDALLVNCNAAQVPALLRVAGVRALERQRTVEIDNQRAGVILGTNEVRRFGRVDFLVNLDGTGEIVGVFDTGLDSGAALTAHTDFHVAGAPGTSRVISVNNLNLGGTASAADIDGHGTHVAGSILGNGANAPLPTPATPTASVPRGMAPAARLVFTSVNDFTLPAPPGLPTDFSQSLVAFNAHAAAGARVHSNSWGSAGNNRYTSFSGSLDQFCWTHPDSVLLFSAGNAEADLNNDGRFDQNFLAPEKTAKNTLVIGASENVTSLDGDPRNYQTRTAPCNRYGTLGASPVRLAANVATAFSGSDVAQDLAMFSNRGRVRNDLRPTHRRIKPDLVAPGTNVLSTRSTTMPASAATIGQLCPPIANPPGIANPRIPATAPAARYQVLSGTSMATPLAAGSCLLVRQFYRQRYGQLRRPQRVQTLTDLIDLPFALANGNQRALAWVHRDAAANRNDIVAALYDLDASPHGAIVTLASGVGAQPAPALALHANHILLLWRDGAGALKLAAFDAALAPLAGFGTAGVITVQASVRTEAERRPGITVRGDQAGVAWFKGGSEDLLFQRFNPANGAALDAQPLVLGTGTATSNHPFILHNGGHWAVFWAAVGAPSSTLLMRFVATSGAPEGAQPLTLLTQAAAFGAPHAVWDARQGRFIVAFMSELAASRGIGVQRLGADGVPFGPRLLPVPLAAGVAGRRARIERHPDGGYVAMWEDASGGSFDVYLSFLDGTGAATAVHRLQISDTPDPVSGFSAVIDANGVVPVWQSSDEANSDEKGLYLLGIGKNGVFSAQTDPATPLLDRAFYVRQTLLTQPFTDRPGCAMVWAGGDFYTVRLAGNAGWHMLELVHLSADGVADAAFGPAGARTLEGWFGYGPLCLAWTGSAIAIGASISTDLRVLLVQPDGRLVPRFGRQGVLSLGELAATTVRMQIAPNNGGALLRLHIAYGVFSADGQHRLKYTIRNSIGGLGGGNTLAAVELARVAGTARQGWFHLLGTETPVHVVAAWHVTVGAQSRVQVQRFRLDGRPQAGQAAPIPLSGAAGDAMNAVIAPRPVQFTPAFPVSANDLRDSRRREFGAAWQQQPAGANWQVWFSRLDRQGVPVTTAGQFDVPVVVSATDHATEPQLVWHGDGYGLAWLQQPIAAGGLHQLMFLVLDPLGQRPNLAAGGAPAAPATPFPVTAVGVDVQSFHLIWTGASFRITWTEAAGTNQLHRQCGIALPRPASGARYDAPFQQPSSALIRATLINGATNLRNTALPNNGNDVNDGYGWGRVNLRQALAPAQPVSFHVRDDASVGPGRRVTYTLRLRRDTRLLRITLAWTDPPGSDIVNHLHLRVTTPPFNPGGVQVLHGNRWRSAAGQTHLSDPVPARAPPFEDTHTVQQVVLAAPPDLPEGDYIVEVICSSLGGGAFQQFPGQPFALVFVGSGPELRTAANGSGAGVGVY